MVKRKSQTIPVWLWLIGIVLAMSFFGFNFFAGVPLNEPEVEGNKVIEVFASDDHSESDSATITIPKGSYIDIISAQGRVRTSNNRHNGCQSC